MNGDFRRRRRRDFQRPRDHPAERAFRKATERVRRTANTNPWLWLTGTVGILAIWYATPVSEWITEIALMEIPVSADIELGRHAARDLVRRQGYSTIHDTLYSPLIDRIGFELVRTLQDMEDSSYSSSSSRYEWDFGIVRSSDVNAYCLPGGVVRVTSSLLSTLLPTNGELAALLGHEMGHVTRRHAQKRMLSQRILQYLLEALFEQDTDFRRSSSSLGHNLGKLLLGATDWLGQQHFSRRDEYQADAVAWDLLVSRYNRYSPESLISLLSKLQRLEEKYRSKSPDSSSVLLDQVAAWSRTHPATKDRIKSLKLKWQALPREERLRLSRQAAG